MDDRFDRLKADIAEEIRGSEARQTERMQETFAAFEKRQDQRFDDVRADIVELHLASDKRHKQQFDNFRAEIIDLHLASEKRHNERFDNFRTVRQAAGRCGRAPRDCGGPPRGALLQIANRGAGPCEIRRHTCVA